VKLLAICESPPTSDPEHGNGSTLISARVLPLLPPDIELQLAYFADRPVPPDAAVLARAASVHQLPLSNSTVGLLGTPFSRLPRATKLRAGARAALLRLADGCDAAYVHGFHAFGVLPLDQLPVVAHEIDPWSDYWAERARTRRGDRFSWPLGSLHAWYDRLQAARAGRLEVSTAAAASAYVVVNPQDAAVLAERLGRDVAAVPNGVAFAGMAPRDGSQVEEMLVGFVGTLDYAPNVEAVTRLARRVFPLVRRQVPAARLTLAGRRPTREVLALVGNGVTVLPDVPDVQDVFARLAVVAYVGRTGRGTKNTLAEALALGCPVVSSRESARGVAPGPHLLQAEDDAALAEQIVRLLLDPAVRTATEEAVRAFAGRMQTWPEVAGRYAELIKEAKEHRG
jgi:glycosyltransferase involved in cell wall biosynthesis